MEIKDHPSGLKTLELGTFKVDSKLIDNIIEEAENPESDVQIITDNTVKEFLDDKPTEGSSGDNS